MKMKIAFIILIFLSNTAIMTSQINEIDLPVKNFELLWNEFDNRYANFELKQVNWNEVYNKYRPLIDERTNNKELFEICCTMLQELNDGHVTIQPDFNEDDINCGPPYTFSLRTEFNSKDKFHEFESVIDTELMNNGFSEPIKKRLSALTHFQYRVSDSFGYLRLDEMTEKRNFRKFKRAVDKSIKAFNQKQGVIIDLRFNGGGEDENAYNLASRFVPKGEAIGHYMRTRINEKNEYTEMEYKRVNSGGKNQFTNSIVILTSDFTASAAEVFLLLMKELPNVTIIGDKTEGIFSTMYEFTLPNEWEVSLSNEQFFSENKENYEGIGIAPDIKILNSRIDIENQNDPVIEMALNYLKKKITANK